MATFQYQFHSEKLEKCFRLQVNQERECCVLDHWWTKQQWVDWNRTQRCSKPCVLARIRHERQTLLLATTGKMSCSYFSAQTNTKSLAIERLCYNEVPSIPCNCRLYVLFQLGRFPFIKSCFCLLVYFLLTA